jgi:hypothetical protein
VDGIHVRILDRYGVVPGQAAHALAEREWIRRLTQEIGSRDSKFGTPRVLEIFVSKVDGNRNGRWLFIHERKSLGGKSLFQFAQEFGHREHRTRFTGGRWP